LKVKHIGKSQVLLLILSSVLNIFNAHVILYIMPFKLKKKNHNLNIVDSIVELHIVGPRAIVELHVHSI